MTDDKTTITIEISKNLKDWASAYARGNETNLSHLIRSLLLKEKNENGSANK